MGVDTLWRAVRLARREAAFVMAQATPPRIRSVGSHDQRDLLARRIADEIGRAIVEWRLRPGDPLNSLALARQFKTSRTPVREALLMLQQDGLVEVPPRRRARVATISLDEVRGIYRVRAALNALLAETLAQEATPEIVQALRACLEPMRVAVEASDVDAYLWANVRFHERASELCSNRPLQRLLMSISYRVLQFRRLSFSGPQRLSQSYRDHVRLVEAIEQRDGVLAAALWRNVMMAGIAAIEASGWTGDVPSVMQGVA